jgi:hypothetical protein
MTAALARPIRPGSPEHRQQRRQQQQQERQRAHQLESLLINDARMLARRDDGQIDQTLESARQTALEAFWQWMDGVLPLENAEQIAAPLAAEINRPQAQQMLRWLRSTAA